MPDWGRLGHAYGSAENLPALLDRLVPETDAEVWDEVWSCLCHQSTVYTASFAALPRLTEIARGWAPADRTMILALSGSIVAGARQPHGAGDVCAIYAAEIEELRRLTGETMRTPIDEATFVHMLRAALAFEDMPMWAELLWPLGHGEYELERCPGCAAHLFVTMAAHDSFVTSGDPAVDDAQPKGELTPAVAAELGDAARHIHDMARGLGRENLATRLLHLFGTATCPACHTTIRVADEVIKQYG